MQLSGSEPLDEPPLDDEDPPLDDDEPPLDDEEPPLDDELPVLPEELPDELPDDELPVLPDELPDELPDDEVDSCGPSSAVSPFGDVGVLLRAHRCHTRNPRFALNRARAGGRCRVRGRSVRIARGTTLASLQAHERSQPDA